MEAMEAMEEIKETAFIVSTCEILGLSSLDGVTVMDKMDDDQDASKMNPPKNEWAFRSMGIHPVSSTLDCRTSDATTLQEAIHVHVSYEIIHSCCRYATFDI